MTAPAEDPAEEQSFSVLNDYLERLHSGGRPDRDRLLAEHPHLAQALKCLEDLDRLAPPPSVAPPGANGGPDLERTVASGVEGAAAEPDSQPPLSRDFGKYELLGELGRGGMGVVYKARQKDLDRPVALKMILASHLASVDYVSRFHDEARAAAGMHHPNIVAVYEAGQVHGQPYFAMQYVGGPSLAELLRQGPLPAEEAARCVAAVARAVGHLHERGFVHRDLKPSNILLDERGQPYVTDFGLVKMLQTDSHKTSTGAILGTPSYMSPEQAAGHVDQVGPLSDVYSLGVILYEALTGQPPFRAETPLDTLVQVIESEPVPPRRLNPRVRPALETVCLRCLEKEPEARYPSALALAEDLERYLNGEGVEARRGGPLSWLRRWTRREPALASRAIVLAVCVLIIQANYQIGHQVELARHLKVMGLFALWGLASLLFQKTLNRKEGLDWIPFAWSAADVCLLTALLLVDNVLDTPFLVAFPTLIATSGLWFRVALVWFTTALCVLAYAFLFAYHMLHGEEIKTPHQSVIVVVALVAVGFVIAYQVHRVRALSRYYEHRPLP
jgi:eukaryotic-like serine/threonine-protein kinase